ncbi:MAG: spore coat U domain-containing protein [Geminicoccaceae bacterium]
MFAVRLLAALLGFILLSTSVKAACTVTSETLAFGTIDASTDNRNKARLTVTCDGPAATIIGISPGGQESGGLRHMVGPGGATLAYQIYRDETRTLVWGDSPTNGALALTVSTGLPVSVDFFGEIPAQPGVTPGTYSDSLVVTLTF